MWWTSLRGSRLLASFARVRHRHVRGQRCSCAIASRWAWLDERGCWRDADDGHLADAVDRDAVTEV